MSRVSKNILYNLTGRGGILLLSFVSVKFIFSQLGEDALGIIYFAAAVNTLLSILFEMGITSTTTREVSAHLHSKPEYIKDLIRTFSLFYWIAFAIAALGIYFLAPLLVEHWINLKTMDTATAVHVLRWLGIASIASLPESLYGNLFRGIQRMEVNNSIVLLTTTAQHLGTIIILALGGGIFLVVYWFVSIYALRILLYLLVAAKFFSPSAFIPGYSSQVIKKNWKFALRVMSISITAAFHAQADRLIIGKFLPVAMVGYYGVAYGNILKGRWFPVSVSQAAYPSFSSLHQKGERSLLISQFRKLQDLVCFGGVPLFALFPFAALPLFSYILNTGVAHMLLLPVILLSLGYYFNSTLSVPYVLALSIGKEGIPARQYLYSLLAVLPPTVILIYFFHLTGAGLSFLLYQLFACSYSVPRYSRECLGIPVRQWLKRMLAILSLAAATYGMSGVLVFVFASPTLIMLILSYGAATILFLSGAYFLISRELLETIQNQLRLFLEKIRLRPSEKMPSARLSQNPINSSSNTPSAPKYIKNAQS